MGTMAYQVLGHTADLRMKISGKNMEELFLSGVSGIAEIIKPGACSDFKKDVEKEIKVDASDATVLLIQFLSKVLTYSHTEKAVFCEANFSKLTEIEIEAKIFGQKIDEFEEDIKAVTYHEAEVKKNEREEYETMIVFDI
ncbi:hypothetical protein A3A09_03070 [Candidatus Nomurabacteria bacterium RIFCSPLOWO2_01_FULL_42_20]|uniref:Archease domain-containing protein n=1 Tax=Candidatus Nomurabacteria bacterium RIFCSPHIGHO2_01_FULL_42_16 TaxID=1801743 RepID=A0A1F6VJ29_9BACT|nr:MAG: hypothetical protein A2824_03170 [Candidatus Nomurabacteria bacterium RIFCSPHIGHO2_01_FULL_42_16]OGI92588.1 MAG: hypothetical protein A3A09_03070 [Candidatus Nomurabacteria bacterium RIFCSPLOWO2_01_FULL_42_20]